MATPTSSADLPQAMIESLTPGADWVVVLPIVLALLGTVVVLVGIIACEVSLVMRIAVEGPLSMTMGKWLPPFGISLTADIFGAAFALAASVVTLLVVLFAEGER